MALVTYKHMVERMPVDELRRTFAARKHTLEYLVAELRGQARSQTLKSYFLFGRRGSGETTLVRMLALRLEEDPELRATWLPVVFTEEVHDVVSLRDLLAAVLRTLGECDVPDARAWHTRVEAEADDRASRDMAVQGLRHIVRAERRRLVVFAENLDRLFAGGHGLGLDRQDRAALRSLLMETNPCLMLIGTAVRMFTALQSYDEALFQYFMPVPLDRLDDEQVRDLLFRRAQFDGRADFGRQYRVNQDKIRALTRLTGGNPRLILMLYEIVTVGAIASVTQSLMELVDSLTPLFKDVLEHQLMRQQAKMLDALMRAGGTAQPTDLVKPTRLSLNAVTTQLGRLKEMEMLELRGGGKGRPAYYCAPDRLFSPWYQLHHLRRNRRRIELFVEFLRLWFEEEARCELLRRLVAAGPEAAGRAEAPWAVEYIAASLQGTPEARPAQDAAIRRWANVGKLDQAAFALAEFKDFDVAGRSQYEAGAYRHLGLRAMEHADFALSMRAAEEAVDRNPEDHEAWRTPGVAAGMSGDHEKAERCCNRHQGLSSLSLVVRAQTLVNRGVSKGQRGDLDGSIADYTAAIELPGAPAEPFSRARFHRGLCAAGAGRVDDALADWQAGARSPGVDPDIRSGLVAEILRQAAGHHRLDEAIAFAVEVSHELDADTQVRFVLGVLMALRSHALRTHWPRVCRALAEGQPPAVAEGLQFLLPVCEVLETGDRGRLDPLPPKQRDFALEALAGFEPPSEGKPPQAQRAQEDGQPS